MTTIQAPAGMAGAREVSEVTSQLKETLLTSTSSSSSSSSSKKGYQLEQDIGTMLYDGESLYKYNILSAVTTAECQACHTETGNYVSLRRSSTQIYFLSHTLVQQISSLSSLLSPLSSRYQLHSRQHLVQSLQFSFKLHHEQGLC